MRLARTLTEYAPNAAVIAVIGGLGWWGHHSHWHLPKPSELFAAPAPVEAVPKPSGPQLLRVGSSEFPLIKFASAEDVKRAGITTAAVTQEDLDDVVQANAVVEYDRAHVAHLSPRTNGRVTHVFKGLGQTVTKGEVLALFDSDEIGRAKADYLQEAGIAAYKAHVLARLRAVGSGVIAERTILDAEAAVNEANLRRFAAHQKLLNLGITADLPEDVVLPPEEMARRLQFAGIPEDVVAKLNPRPRTANLVPLVAPFDGVVTKQDAVIGELEHPEVAAMTVADVTKVWVWLSVRKEDAGRLAVGQPVEFKTDGRKASSSGRIAWVSTEIDPKSRTVQVRADVTNPYHPPESAAPAVLAAGGVGAPVLAEGLHPVGSAEQPRVLMANMFGTGRVLVAKMDDARLVPEAAVQTMETAPGTMKKLVFVARPDGVTFEPRVVEPGRTQNGMTQIVEGLSPGDKVAVGASYVLKSELMLAKLAGGD